MYDPSDLYVDPILPNFSVGYQKAEHPQKMADKTAANMGHPSNKGRPQRPKQRRKK